MSSRVRLILALGLAAVTFVVCGYVLLVRAHLLPVRVDNANGRFATGSGTISGTTLGPEGTPVPARVTLVATPGTIRLAPTGRGRNAGSGFAPISTTADASGRYELHGVPAGSFILVSHAEIVGDPPALAEHLWAVRDVNSTGRDQVDAPLQLETGHTITGRVVTLPETPMPPPAVINASVVLKPADSRTQAILTTGAPTARADASGGFILTAVPPGRYSLDAPPPAGWSLDSATLEGRSWLDAPLEIDLAGSVLHLNLVWLAGSNTITGVVKSPDGRPSGFALVMVWSADAALRQSPRRIQAARAGADGRFAFDGFPAGDYYVSTVELPVQEWYTTTAFDRLARTAPRVSVARGATATVNLTTAAKH